MQRRRYLALFTAVGLTGLAGCNDDGQSTTTAPTARTTTARSTTATTRTPTRTTTETTTETTEPTTEETTTETTSETTEETTTDPGPSDQELAREDYDRADAHFGEAVTTYASWAVSGDGDLADVSIASEAINPTDVVRRISRSGKALDDAAEHDALVESIRRHRYLNRWLVASVRAQHALSLEYDRFEEAVEVAFGGDRSALNAELDAIDDAATTADDYYADVAEYDASDAVVTRHLSESLHRRKTEQVGAEIDGARSFEDAMQTLVDAIKTFESAARDFTRHSGPWGQFDFENAVDDFDDAVDELAALDDSVAIRDATASAETYARVLRDACELFVDAAVDYRDDDAASGRQHYDDGIDHVEAEAEMVFLWNDAAEQLRRDDPPK